METQLLKETDISAAAELLLQGELVAFPTETVYGLGALASSPTALQKIFVAKRRPCDNPLIVHVHSLESVRTLAQDIPMELYALAHAFWPGPLTLILRKQTHLPKEISGGLETIAVRIPSAPLAQRLLERTGPLAAPSANLSGKPSATKAAHVLEDFRGTIAAVIDGGECDLGIESTVLHLVDPKAPLLLRPGAISKEEMESILQRSISVATGQEMAAAASPGMKYRHYAPRARVHVFQDKEGLFEYLDKHPKCHRLLMTADPLPDSYPLRRDTFYSLFRAADQASVEEILVVCNETTLKDDALMNRLLKAALEEPDLKNYLLANRNGRA